MKKAWKYAGIAALVLVLGLVAIGAVAFAQGPEGDADGPFNFYERFRQTLASILGISVEEYDSAVGQAQEQVLTDAVTEGWLTQDQADRMRERMDQAPAGGPWGMGRGFGKHGRGMMMGGWDMKGGGVNLLSVASDQLGMTQADLLTALRDGQTIAGLAAEKGIDAQAIADAYIAQLTANLNQAVSDGTLAQKQADWMLEQAQTQVPEQLNSTWEQRGPHGFPGGRWPCPPTDSTEDDA